MHVLPSGFHRIRHYGLFANAERKDNLAKARALLHAVPKTDAAPSNADAPAQSVQPTFVCPDCGAAMIITGIFVRGQHIRAPPQQRIAA